jgi:hypothetical protein
MSTRAERRRQARRDAKQRCAVPANHGVLVGWAATEADLPEARQITHDKLIALMGDRRTGGVEWRTVVGAQAEQALGTLQVGASPTLADHYRRLGGMLREYGGFLVVASAAGRPA